MRLDEDSWVQLHLPYEDSDSLEWGVRDILSLNARFVATTELGGTIQHTTQWDRREEVKAWAPDGRLVFERRITEGRGISQAIWHALKAIEGAVEDEQS